MLLIYTQQDSSRLQYVMQLFFGELIRTGYETTSDAGQFKSYNGPKFNYSKQRFGNEFFIHSHDLLFETGIHEQQFSVGERKGIKTFFQNESGDFSFDAFAAAFYFVSRYEEYLPFKSDKYGRAPDQENLLVRERTHQIPLINHYGIWLKETLSEKFPQLLFQTSSFEFQLTYDIDFAFAYRGKGWVRNAAGFIRSFLKLDSFDISLRSKVLQGKARDPFDTFDYQFSIQKRLHLFAIYFFLLSDYGKLDKNIPWHNHPLQSIIKKISENYETGIHCGFASNDDPQKVKTEIHRLSKITGKKVFRNRQHFLKLKFPTTYQTLLENGITEDYTMGFASEIGFRAGIASPFYWYDLSKEQATALRIFPFAVMDATLYYYLKLSAEEGYESARRIIEEVKKVHGYFQFLAHNDLLSETLWPEWRNKFEELLDYACEK